MPARELLTSNDLVAPVLVQPAHRPAHEHAQLSGSVPVDHLASAALRTDNLLVTGIGVVRSTVPDMVIATEVWLRLD